MRVKKSRIDKDVDIADQVIAMQAVTVTFMAVDVNKSDSVDEVRVVRV